MTIEGRILLALFASRKRLALHEFKLSDVSPGDVRAHLAKLEISGRVRSSFRICRPFKEWFLTGIGRVYVETHLAAKAVDVQPGAVT